MEADPGHHQNSNNYCQHLATRCHAYTCSHMNLTQNGKGTLGEAEDHRASKAPTCSQDQEGYAHTREAMHTTQETTHTPRNSQKAVHPFRYPSVTTHSSISDLPCAVRHIPVTKAVTYTCSPALLPVVLNPFSHSSPLATLSLFSRQSLPQACQTCGPWVACSP